MDYENECGSAARAWGRVPQEAGQLCNMERVLWAASPWFHYGEWLQRNENHTCLIDIGIGAAFPGAVAANQSQGERRAAWNNTRAHTELELEMSLRQGHDFVQTVLRDVLFTGLPSQSALFHHFAVFEHLNLLGVSASYPCPEDHAACAADRPPRALWMYDMVDVPGKPQPLCNAYPTGYQCNVLVDAAARLRFFDWCTERNVVELYIGVNPLLRNATLSAALVAVGRKVSIAHPCTFSILKNKTLRKYTGRYMHDFTAHG
jgi:hypothetical protein